MLWKILAGLAVTFALIVTIAWNTTSTVVVERTFNAPVDKVWITWTDTEKMKQWWSPKDFTAPVIKNDFKLGGNYLFSMRSPKGEMFWNTGTYKEIVMHQKIVSSMWFSDENGKLVPGKEVKAPGSWPDEISVTVEFKAVDGKTTVQVTEVGIPNIMKILAKMGWHQQFDKFATLL